MAKGNSLAEILDSLCRLVEAQPGEVLASRIEGVVRALFLANGRTDIALAWLRVQADFLKMKGTPPPLGLLRFSDFHAFLRSLLHLLDSLQQSAIVQDIHQPVDRVPPVPCAGLDVVS